MDPFTSSNRELWNEWTDIHETSAFYDVDAFRAGDNRIRPFEREEVGDVTGKTLLHLQCHFGLDTLSWARLGATVTGADFSPKAIALARRLAEEVGITDARFVESSIEDLPSNLDGEFDIVYTSRGVIIWLRDLKPWAAAIARFLKPGGVFYIHEGHPAMWVFDDERTDRELRVRYPYFSREAPLEFPVQGSYADPTAEVKTEREYGWVHTLGDVVSVLAGAGLRIEWLHEHPFLSWPLPFLVPAEDGASPGGDGRTWVLPPEGGEAEIPLSFSLRATKPA